jgi:hypothetical protein
MGCLSTARANYDVLSLLVLISQFHKAFLAVGVLALELFRVSVSLKTDGTLQLLLQSPQGCLSH